MHAPELVSYLVVLLISLVPLLLGFRYKKSFRWLIPGSVLLFAAGTAALMWRPVDDVLLRMSLPRQDTSGEFVSSNTCRSCHPSHYESWHASYHRTMTQVASPSTVLAPFDGRTLSSRGRSYGVERRGEEFWVHMPDPDWEALQQAKGVDLTAVDNPPMVDRRVVMTTGSHHLQEYWIPSKWGNQLHEFPFVYRIKEERWIPREAAFLTPPHKPGGFPNWNYSCMRCHSTGSFLGLNQKTGEVTSRVAEFGIACEACHGPAEKHVRWHRNPVRRMSSRVSGKADSTIVNPERRSPKVASEICGQCHSYNAFRDHQDYLVNGAKYRAGGDLWATRRLLEFGEKGVGAAFWDDGTIRVSGREYPGLINSGCYQHGELSCLSCHSMHDSPPNDQLARGMDSNAACIQCHASFGQRIEDHTHHPAESQGSQCYNCHMPYTSYGLLTAIRSHLIDSPSAAMSVNTDRPNACNLCHLDQTLSWTAKHLSDWYQVDAIDLSEDEQEIAASLLWMLQGDALQRAISAWHMGWSPALEASGSNWQAPFVAQLLDDPYAAVRFIAHRSLRRLPGFGDYEYDYVSSADERRQHQVRVTDNWKTNGIPPDRSGDRILVDSQRNVDAGAIRRLREKRNDQDVHIAE